MLFSLGEILHQAGSCVRKTFLKRVNRNMGRHGGFVSRIYAGEILDQALTRFAIQTFRVAAFTFGQGRINEYFDKVVLADNFSGQFTVTKKRRDKCTNRDYPGIYKQFGDFCDTSDIFFTILVGETKVTAKTQTNIVSIEQIRVTACISQRQLKGIGHCGFSCPTEAREPDYGWPLLLQSTSTRLINTESMSNEIFGHVFSLLEAVKIEGQWQSGIIKAV
ncbi:hypothetical protein AO065_18450 [Pseudomonas viridiflava]|nr:hypothetical protein PVFL_01700 [Pseudomonas viridiflava]OAG90278.1 hypothetical protein AO065_18450 [Pseudomonas viridiflava]